MSKITPHLWFDTQAKEAAEFYSEVFPDSHVTNVTTLRDTPSGDCDVSRSRSGDTTSWRSAPGRCSRSTPRSRSSSTSIPTRSPMRRRPWTGSGRSSPTEAAS